MSIAQVRGGIPHVFRETITTAGQKHRLPHYSFYLIIRAATAPCKMYFTEADFTDDVNYVSVPVAAAATPHGEWQGPVEACDVWLKGDGGSSNVELVTFQRRG
jgi:hypothetical protein